METQLQTTTDNIPTKARGFDLSLAIEYRYKNHLTLQEIGDKLGVTKQCVEQRLAKVIKLIGDPSENTAYDKNRSHFLIGIERQLLQQVVDKNKVKKATMGNVAYALDKVNNILRLERGLSTNNQAVQIQVIRFSDQPKVEEETGKQVDNSCVVEAVLVDK